MTLNNWDNGKSLADSGVWIQKVLFTRGEWICLNLVGGYALNLLLLKF